ncbi:ribonuclease HIII [Acholeplasma laidlawii]|uniref:Ribonuclease n=2 Tax=Acholeplasma laidlawii TaxID=2148 RepID=A9NGE9_ACHLI|nr:ribonuclease HIII [Acholeplasma laidlawii]ABX81429.1 ribonuclease HIII [Acholeplasma laidlawii PG-8A]NWH09995.1 ribonuclease HIII [Acholeplasma laidlawii]NWH11385.1 ribonuclease HIII [Acholeplasma laidlawii]NWH13205.1 ribonuclease HIII [Acholeplasma laidlawii]NWH15162.1 ribonuclease HIII [Acholeplasma laidlawii]
MRNYTISLSSDQLVLLKQFYSNYLLKVEQPYVFFVAHHNDTRISAFKSGKVVLQGEEINPELVAIKSFLNITNYAAIGSDEVGTGDALGPVVVCSAYASIEDIEFLEKLGVKDSKSMTNKEIVKLGPVIANRLTHSIVILTPEKFNEQTQKGLNLNKIKALLHNHMIIKTTSKVEAAVPVILDQFCLPTHYFNYLKDEKLVYRDVEFYTKAESVHLSVAAASIIARYAFLVKMHQYSKKLNMKLKLGASKEVDVQIKEIYDTHGLDGLNKIAKMNFKNVTKQNLT